MPQTGRYGSKTSSADAPDEIAAKSYGLDGDMTEVLERLKQAVKETNDGGNEHV